MIIMGRTLFNHERPVYFIEMTKPSTHHVDFTVYQCLEVVNGQPVLGDDEMGGMPQPDKAKARIYLAGHVKWDGCMNCSYDRKGCMSHFCGLDGWKVFLRAVQEVYAMARELMPEHAEYLS